jgi:hypothetical protein
LVSCRKDKNVSFKDSTVVKCKSLVGGLRDLCIYFYFDQTIRNFLTHANIDATAAESFEKTMIEIKILRFDGLEALFLQASKRSGAAAIILPITRMAINRVIAFGVDTIIVSSTATGFLSLYTPS